MYAYSSCVLSSCVRLMLTYFIFLLFPFFDFDLDIVCFILSFSCGYYAVSSVSVSAATGLAYNMHLDTYVRWSHLFIFVWGIPFVSVIVCTSYYLMFFIRFPPELIFRSTTAVIGACPVTTDCIVAMSKCENNNHIQNWFLMCIKK